MRVKWYELLQPCHEYVPNPKSASEFGESYEDTGMARPVARTTRADTFFTRMIVVKGEGEEENGQRGEGRLGFAQVKRG